MAPFTPFSSEDIWQKLKTNEDEESIHLTEWSKEGVVDFDLIKEMIEVREVVTFGLQARQKENIPVRQPLKKIRVSGYKIDDKYIDILKDELNIKEAEIIEGVDKKVELDAFITEELKKEGQYRELLRAIQDIRKKNGLNPNDVVTLVVNTNKEEQKFINTFSKELMKAVGVKAILFKENNGGEIKISELVFKIGIEK